jgi:uracil-DNA glycosylase
VPAWRAPHPRPPARPSTASPPRWPAAAAAHGWSPGASRWPGRSGPPSATRSTGADPSPASATRRPAAHGGNRTGRIFTGDRSGDWLFASLHRTGFANQPTSVSRDDGLALTDCYVTAPVKCAPPDNKPLPSERDNCAPWLTAELDLLEVRVVVALGAFAWDQALRHLGPVRPKPRFGHAAEAALPAGRVLLGSYHVSQQNTATGRLTEAMLDRVFLRARHLLSGGPEIG